MTSVRFRELAREAELEREARCLPFGRLLLDRDRRIVYASPRAQEFLSGQDGLVERDGRFETVQVRADAALMRSLAMAWERPEEQFHHVAVRPSGRLPWALRLSVTTRAQMGSLLEVLIIDPDARVAPPAEVLSIVHGLSASETSVLERLLQGMPIAEVAQSTGRAVSTTRLRVERILKKTATHRQTELVLRWVMPMLVSLQGPTERNSDE